jgi:hypothetical protein
MLVLAILQLAPESAVETAVAALLKVTDTAEIVRWIEFPASVLLRVIYERPDSNIRFQAPFPGPERIQIVPGGRITYPAAGQPLTPTSCNFPRTAVNQH